MQKLDELGRDWTEFKGVVTKRVADLESGKGVAELDEKISKIDAAIADNQKTIDEINAERKAMAERIGKMEAERDSLGLTQFNEQKAIQTQHMELFTTWIRTGEKSGKAAADLRAFEAKLGSAGVTGTTTAGGYAIPEILHNVIAEQALKISPMRQEITIVSAANADFRVLVDATNTNSGWVAETDTRSDTKTSNLVERVPTFGTVYARVSATEESVNDIGFDVASWIARGVAAELAKAEGNAFLVGNGTKKPTGLLNSAPTAVGEHVSPARAAAVFQYFPMDPGVSPASTIQAGAIFDLVYGLTAAYRSNAKFIANSATIGTVRKLRESSGTGQFLWQPSLIVGQPATLAGYPIIAMEDMADVALDALPIAFGDLKKAYIGVDIAGMKTTIDDNITVPGYVKWYVRKRIGGCVWDNNALKVGKISKT